MALSRRGALLKPLLLLPLAACSPGGFAQISGPPATASERAAEACQMRGAAAEDRYAGPVGDLSIDSAIIRAEVTQACLRHRQ